MSSIVFKQSYKARASPGVAGLNVRHLQYIATRPGAIYNKGCGFGLWGQLPGDDAIRIQTDLSRAKWLVREASAEHTLYRAIISVGQKDAENHGLYRRERWEQLVNDHIHVLAKEMDIRPEDFCWCASMHRSKGHPHVHILYWDNSDRPRSEGIPKHLFEGKAERIRAEFAGDIYRERILDTQNEQKEQTKALRTVLQSMCQEANPEKTLNLPKLYKSTQLEGITRQMAELIRQLPAKGSLRYAYLPPDYKKLVDELIGTCLEYPELAKELTRYEALTNRISTLYANGEAGKFVNLVKAREKLHKELGNEVMNAIRQIRSEIQEDRPTDQPAAQLLIRQTVDEIVPTLDSYQELGKLLPPDLMVWQVPGYQEQMNQVVQDVMHDARVRLRLQRYALEAAGIDLSTKPTAPQRKSGAQVEATGHFMDGKLLSVEEWNAYQDTYREIKRELRGEISDRLRLNAIRDSCSEIQADWLSDRPTVHALIREAVHEIAPNLDSYKKLHRLLPLERIPLLRMSLQISGYHGLMNQVVQDVMQDARVRLRLHRYALETAGIDLNTNSSVPEGDLSEQAAEGGVFTDGKLSATDEWKAYRDAYREINREIKRTIRQEITATLRRDAGWTDEAVKTGSAMMLCSMMSLLSRLANQKQATISQSALHKLISKDKSREAKKDAQAQSSQGSEWDPEW